MGTDGNYGGKAKSKRWVFRYLLKVATEMAEQTGSERLFPRDGAQEWKALAPVLVLTLGTDKLLSLFDLSEQEGSRCGKHGVKINRLFFTQGFVGQQIDLKKYSKPYWHTNEGNEAVEVLRVNGGDFVTRRAEPVDSEHAWSLVRSISAIPYKIELQ